MGGVIYGNGEGQTWEDLNTRSRLNRTPNRSEVLFDLIRGVGMDENGSCINIEVVIQF